MSKLLRVLPFRHRFLYHAFLHTYKKLSNFLLYVESGQGQAMAVTLLRTARRITILVNRVAG